MSIKDLIPFKSSGKKGLPLKRSDGDPFDSLHREINRVFENFTSGFWDSSPFSTGLMDPSQGSNFSPSVDVMEDKKHIRVMVELPGMSEKDVQVSLTDNELLIRGEKKLKPKTREKTGIGRKDPMARSTGLSPFRRESMGLKQTRLLKMAFSQ